MGLTVQLPIGDGPRWHDTDGQDHKNHEQYEDPLSHDLASSG
jgi:hypothetical protein